MTIESHHPKIWLYHALKGQSGSYLQAIINELHEASITYTTKGQEGESSVLLLLGEEALRVEAPDCLCELLASGLNIIILYTGDQPLPYYRAWQWLNMGVEEVLSLRNRIEVGKFIRARLNRWATIDRILNSEQVKSLLVGSSPEWQKTLWQVVEIACFSTVPVLIQGESGTGKELIARLIHELDKRPDKQGLVLLDCTTIVPELSGSEFFGHEKGAFTNAVSSRDGAFALADRGSLFLDEIGELPLRLQAELLRVSQEGIYKKVGSNMWKKTKFRLISATHRNLLDEVEKGNFRQDLFYRIRTCSIHLPALRERKLDILELAEHFLKQNLKTDTPPPFSRLMAHYLMSCEFPGNVRELKQLIARMAYRYCGNGPITLGHLPVTDRQAVSIGSDSWQENGFHEAINQALADGVGLKDIKRIVGEVAMELAIEKADGNLQEAARKLGVSDRLVQGFWSGKRD